MNRKILFLIIIIIALIILGLVLFFVIGKGDVSQTPIISRFFPASEEREAASISEQEKEEERIIATGERKEEKLIQLSDKPVISAAFSSSTNKVRYLEKINGHLYEIESNGKNKNRISNVTILNIFEVRWSKEADKTVLRFEKDGKIKNFAASFAGTSTEGAFLNDNLKSIAASPEENKIAYLEKTGERGAIFIADFNGQNKKQIFSVPLSDWALFWQDKDNLSLLAPPSAFSKGFLYSLNIKNKNLEKLLEGNGLNVLWSKNGKDLLISENTGNTIQNKVILNNKEYGLSSKTLPEKCVWSAKESGIVFCAVPLNFPFANYPDDWYQGKISFKDVVFKINYLTGENNIIDGEISDLDFDAINLFLSSDEKYLFFINKKDSMIWSMKIK